jgi:hypothetical protein
MTAWPGMTPTPSVSLLMRQPIGRCQNNNLSLSVIKTKEMIGLQEKDDRACPILIDRAVVEQVEISLVSTSPTDCMVQAHQDSREEAMTKPIPPQETEKIWHCSSDPQTAAPSRASWLHRWQVLGLRLQGTTDGSAYRLFSLILHGKWSRSKRLLNSFYPQDP